MSNKSDECLISWLLWTFLHVYGNIVSYKFCCHVVPLQHQTGLWWRVTWISHYFILLTAQLGT